METLPHDGAPTQAFSRTDEQREELLARTHALGWSQNKLARRARLSGGYVSKVLAGDHPAPEAWRKLFAAVEKEERRRAEKVA